MINLQNNNILYGSDVAVPVPLGGINIKDESLGIDWRIPVEKAILKGHKRTGDRSLSRIIIQH